MKYEINTLEALQSVVDREFQNLIKADAILLNGDLGLGKTTFSQILAKALGIEGYVKSPTFSIISTYDLDKKFKKSVLHHCDLYRMNDEDELYHIGFEDLFNKDSLVIIEWANLFKDYIEELCENRVNIELYFEGENRYLEIK